jgi:hypothetical protein
LTEYVTWNIIAKKQVAEIIPTAFTDHAVALRLETDVPKQQRGRSFGR